MLTAAMWTWDPFNLPIVQEPRGARLAIQSSHASVAYPTFPAPTSQGWGFFVSPRRAPTSAQQRPLAPQPSPATPPHRTCPCHPDLRGRELFTAQSWPPMLRHPHCNPLPSRSYPWFSPPRCTASPPMQPTFRAQVGPRRHPLLLGGGVFVRLFGDLAAEVLRRGPDVRLGHGRVPGHDLPRYLRGAGLHRCRWLRRRRLRVQGPGQRTVQ